MKPNFLLLVLNYLFALLILMAAGLWLYTGDTFGWVMGLAGLVAAVGILLRQRWSYFVAAAWCFGLMRLAMDKYSGVYPETWKSAARGMCLLGIVLAVVLHETLAKKRTSGIDSPALNNNSEDGPGMPR